MGLGLILMCLQHASLGDRHYVRYGKVPYNSRMSSCIGRNAQFCCERTHLHAVLRHFSFDDVLANSTPTNDISLSYANVISELDLVRDDMLSFTDSQFLLLMHVV